MSIQSCKALWPPQEEVKQGDDSGHDQEIQGCGGYQVLNNSVRPGGTGLVLRQIVNDKHGARCKYGPGTWHHSVPPRGTVPHWALSPTGQ